MLADVAEDLVMDAVMVLPGAAWTATALEQTRRPTTTLTIRMGPAPASKTSSLRATGREMRSPAAAYALWTD